MATTYATELDHHARGLLALAAGDGPLLRPIACWWDGGHLWVLPPPGAEVAACLRAEPSCSAALPTEAGAVIASGRARVFSLDDPKGLLLHAPVISGALTALTLRAPGVLSAPGGLLPRLPQGWPPGYMAVLRLDVDGVADIAAPEPVGIAPALPAQIPVGVRRALAGQRLVTVAAAAPRLQAAAGTWASGFALRLAGDLDLPPGTPVTAGLEVAPDGRFSVARGVAMRGQLDAHGAIAATHVDWWHGLEVEGAPVDLGVPPSAIDLPE